jgi:hypothetical protein
LGNACYSGIFAGLKQMCDMPIRVNVVQVCDTTKLIVVIQLVN